MLLSNFKVEKIFLLVIVLYSLFVLFYIFYNVNNHQKYSGLDLDFETRIIEDYYMKESKEVCPFILQINETETAYCI